MSREVIRLAGVIVKGLTTPKSLGFTDRRQFVSFALQRAQGKKVRHPNAPETNKSPLQMAKNLDDSVLSSRQKKQLLKAWHHDARVAAFGIHNVDILRCFEFNNVSDRHGIELEKIDQLIPCRPHAMIFIPRIEVGGAEKYAADICQHLVESGVKDIVIVVSEQKEISSRENKENILYPFTYAYKLFMRDISKSFHTSPLILARMTHMLKPRHVFVVNCRAALEMISVYGRVLSQETLISCAYFSMGIPGIGGPYGNRFPRKTAPYSVSLTDNEPMRQVLESQTAGLGGPGVCLIPPKIKPTSDVEFSHLVSKRMQLRKKTGRKERRKWAWVGRPDPYKGIRILELITELRLEDEFYLFGPGVEKLQLSSTNKNIILNGSINVSSFDWSSFDGYISTSLFEGLPNTILELSQKAVPMVLSRVGGLEAVFTNNYNFFVDLSESEENNANLFHKKMEYLISIDENKMESILYNTKNSVDEYCSEDSYSKKMKHLIESSSRNG